MNESPVITRIELDAFEIHIPGISTDRAGLGVSYVPGADIAHTRFAVRIHTDAGIVGGYVPPRGRAKVIMRACEALAYGLIGKPALAREQHYLSMRRSTKHIGEVGIGALDIALWDVAGKTHNASIATLLGAHRRRLPAYASTLGGDRHADGLSSPEAYADFAERCKELGYPGYKMHGWSDGNPIEEIAMLEAVAERVGAEMDLMYDSASHLKTFADAVRVGRVLDWHNYFWFEDPYADGGISINGHRRLKEHVKTPLLITEFVRNAETTIDILVAGATDFARVDPDYDGGITGCYKTALAAQALGMDVEVHACGPAMRHLMAALGNSNFYEINLVHPRTANAWSLPVYASDYADELDSIDSNGCVEVPSGPGLGVEYDWDYIERHRTERVVIE